MLLFLPALLTACILLPNIYTTLRRDRVRRESLFLDKLTWDLQGNPSNSLDLPASAS